MSHDIPLIKETCFHNFFPNTLNTEAYIMSKLYDFYFKFMKCKSIFILHL